MNKVIEIGNVCNEVKVNDAKTVARYNLAVSRYKEGTDFIPCVCFGKQVEFAEKYLRKGMKIAVEGRLQSGSYEKDGEKRSTLDLVVENHEFVEKKSNDNSGMAQINAPIETDFTPIPEGITELPFD